MADRSSTAMPALEAKRTLVKSPPEIWAEVSDAGALARHLGEFGEIRITRTQPESVVEWEGDLASGCVRLEPSGWGTKVTLTAEPALRRARARHRPEPEPEPEPAAGAEPEPHAPGVSWWSRLSGGAAPEPEPAPGPRWPPSPSPSPTRAEPAPRIDPSGPQAALTGVLDTLGAAHHRPFCAAVTHCRFRRVERHTSAAS